MALESELIGKSGPSIRTSQKTEEGTGDLLITSFSLNAYAIGSTFGPLGLTWPIRRGGRLLNPILNPTLHSVCSLHKLTTPLAPQVVWL